ncbi:MAG: hypothetical protein L0219_10560 [Phycisphaerales bacterium]|nr:hypothetical protein [Phycisphaerales bacterium]MCI0676158.1 hypothetical protein [Phycisphaerales bacterium]
MGIRSSAILASSFPAFDVRFSAQRLRAALRRAFWAVLALVHIAPVVGTTRALFLEGLTAPGAFKVLLLGLALAFFVLKLVDARFLRWRLGRRGTVAFVVTCALMHGDVSADAGNAVLAEVPAACAISVLWEGVSRAGGLVPRAIRLLSICWRSLLTLDAASGQVLARFARCLSPCVIVQPLIPRAPPA